MKNKIKRILSVMVLISVSAGCNHVDDSVQKIRNKPQLKVGSESEFEENLRNYLTSQVIQAQKDYDHSDDGWNFFGLFGSSSSGSSSVTLDHDAPLVSAELGVAHEYQQYSTTNLVQRGVDESDLVKTDGKSLFVGVNPDYEYRYVKDVGPDGLEYAGDFRFVDTPPVIRIMGVDETPAATESSIIKLPETITDIQGLYISQYDEQEHAKQILVVARSYPEKIVRSGRYGFYNSTDTIVYAYDVRATSAPVLQWTVGIQGDYVASRRLNDRLYLISNKFVQLTGFDPWDASTDGRRRNTRIVDNVTAEDVLPHTSLNGNDADFVVADDCLVPVEQSYSAMYGVGVMSVLAIPYAEPVKTAATCTLESSHEIYVSTRAIYFSIGDYYQEKDTTLIHKLAFTEAGLSYKASGRVDGFTGWRNTEFRMSEYNDKLRVLTTEYDDSFSPVHRIRILEEDEANSELKLIAQLPNDTQTTLIGKPDEEVYGVRFYGDYAYVVTYRTFDPLYVINLVDPAAPFVEGALELPGFSEYLHPIGDDLLLGIGRDVEESGSSISVKGIKLGLFDVSDKTSPVLLDEVIIGTGGTNSPVLSDYKALTLLSGEVEGGYRFAFPLQVYAETQDDSPRGYGSWSYSGLGMFEINQGETIVLNELGTLKTSSSKTTDYDDSDIYQARSVIIDNNVHYVLDGQVWSAPWGDVDSATEAQ